MNQKGFSLPEILISLGVLGAIGLGVTNLITSSAKKKTEMDQRMNRMTIEKRIETYFYSDIGCEVLKGKKIGDPIVLDPDKFPKKVGKTEMTDLQVAQFIPTDSKGIHGIAKVTLTLLEKTSQGSDKHFVREFPMPVNVKTVSGSVVIEDCRMGHTKAFNDIVKRVCEGTFGSKTTGLSCAEAIAQVETLIIKDICADIYGSKTAQFNSTFCDVNHIHANKTCAPGVLVGFDMQGNPLCKNLPTTGATSGKPKTPELPEEKAKTPKPCTSWSAWAPDASATCSDKQVAQTRTCSDGSSSETEAQTVQGTKDCGGGGCVLDRPLSWESSDSDPKEGIATCVEEEAPPLNLKNWESYKAESRGACENSGLNCVGSFVVQCQNGKIEFVGGGCTVGAKKK